MVTVGFLGGLGPFELGFLLLVFAVVGVVWFVLVSTHGEDGIEWHWLIGITILFLMGVLPGLVGIWLYLSTHATEDGTAGESGVVSSSLLGVVLLFGSLVAGSVLGTVVDELAGTDAPAWVAVFAFLLGAVGTFVLVSYLLYGR